MEHRILNSHNIEVLYNTETKEIIGDGQVVTGVKVFNNKTGGTKTLDVTGVFVAIGHHPNTEIFKDWIDMNENGYIITQPGSSKTNIEGVFACGDAQDHVYR